MSRLLMIVLAVSVSSCGLTNRLQLDAGRTVLKTVSAKAEPVTLVALDRTECTVTPSKFEKTEIGDAVWCAWRSRDGTQPPGAVGVGGPVPEAGVEASAATPSLPPSGR